MYRMTVVQYCLNVSHDAPILNSKENLLVLMWPINHSKALSPINPPKEVCSNLAACSCHSFMKTISLVVVAFRTTWLHLYICLLRVSIPLVTWMKASDAYQRFLV